MHHSLDSFRQDYQHAVTAENQRLGVPDAYGTGRIGNINADIDKAWQLYVNSKFPTLDLALFGRFNSDPARAATFLGIDTSTRRVKIKRGGLKGLFSRHAKYKTVPSAMLTNFGVVNDTQTGGSIQQMNSWDWNLHVNDAWLLGGIHRCLPFYAASPLTADNVFLQNHATAVLGITGRELFGLLMAGYRPQTDPALGTVMQCRDAAKAQNLTLKDIETGIDFIERGIGEAGTTSNVDKGRAIFRRIANRAGIVL